MSKFFSRRAIKSKEYREAFRNKCRLLYFYRNLPLEEFLKLEHLLPDVSSQLYVFTTPMFFRRDISQIKYWLELCYVPVDTGWQTHEERRRKVKSK